MDRGHMKHCLVIAGLLAVATCLAAAEYVEYTGAGLPGEGRKIVLLSGDQEYRSEEALPQIGRILAQHHGFHCRVLFVQNPGVECARYQTDQGFRAE